jgi:curved DNA-binding protein
LTEPRRIAIGADYYRVLGVPRNASAQEIHRAYRRLARQHHPDISGQSAAADRFRAVSEAYEVLHDPERRANYDHRLASPTRATRSRPDTTSRTSATRERRDRASPSSPAHAEAILELSPQEAALAASVPLRLSDARGNWIELPAGTHHGQRLRISRANRRPGRPPGDLILTIQVRGATTPHLTYSD